jgi:hypothetical protein
MHGDSPTTPHARDARARRGTPARPRVTGYGQLNVSSEGGWADVLEGSRRLGRTPLRLNVTAGRHVLTVLPFGQPPARRIVVDVEPNAVERVSVRIAP